MDTMRRCEPTEVYARVVSPYSPPPAPVGQVNHYHYVTMVPRPVAPRRRVLTSYTPAQAVTILFGAGLLAALCGGAAFVFVLSLLAATP